MNTNYDTIITPEEELKTGAKAFEVFWLRPKKMHGKEYVLRMKLNKGWNGWKLKDELVRSLDLEVGDTMNTEVSVLLRPGLIDDADDTDLFASGTGADWLLDNNIGNGSVIEAKVKFVYSQAPVGGREGKEVWKLSLVFIEGYRVVENMPEQDNTMSTNEMSAFESLRKLLGS